MKDAREQMANLVLEANCDGLLNGAVDMHCHAYPDLGLGVKRRTEDLEMLKLALDAGMRAIVLKSHAWPTTAACYQLRQQLSGIEVFGSISLNTTTGGLQPWIVELAAQQGAKVVWMPTWSSESDWTSGGFSGLMKGWLPSLKKSGLKEPLTVIDSSGRLRPEVRDILDIAKEQGLVVSTGHISPQESLALADQAARIGFTKLVYGHPLSGVVKSSMEQMKEMADRGAFIELCALNGFWPSIAPGESKLHETAQVIAEFGSDHCILTTDSFFEWPPPPSEFMRMFMGSLMLLGIHREDIATMVQRNPSVLLDLQPVPGEPASDS